jgi:PKD repeat protein
MQVGARISAMVVCVGLWSALAAGQSLRREGTEFNALRMVSIPPGKSFAIVVTQFLHHGEIRDDGRNVAVFPKNNSKPVPMRLLQNGPGDFCRIAFQVIEGQNVYEILYGGEPLKDDALPPWTADQGLLLETREFKNCNLNNYQSVREAYQSSKRIGSDYVDGVHQADNPFTLKRGPFLSRYSGLLRIATAGTYGFITSSQDCSFLVIDDKPVTEHAGMHPPRHQATPGTRKDIALTAGPHKFEYYHAAAASQAMMLLVWEINPGDAKPKPAVIPPEAFAAAAIGRETAGPATTRTEKLVPDFLPSVEGSVPLPDNETPLVGVRFLDTSPRALAGNSKYHWEFGDGQSSDRSSPDHVYLCPGLYAVKLTIRRGPKPFEVTNRVYIDEPKVTDPAKLHQLDDYLRVLESYDARALDARSLKQLVLAFQAKVDMLRASSETADRKAAENPPETRPATDPRRRRDAKAALAEKFVAAAVAAGQVAFAEDSAVRGDEELIQLARIIGPMARDQLGNSQAAAAIWQGAARKITNPELRAECFVEAADIAVNDRSNAAAAKPLLEAATKVLGGDRAGPMANRFFRVWGDYYALTADGKSARKAYTEAEAAVSTRKSQAERTAWQGARGRSTEQFLKSGELDRAIVEIRQWQDEFPSDKIAGHLTLSYARYWAGREKYQQAVALAGQLSAVNADSPYADQMQILSARCHVAMGAPEVAVSTLESLVKSDPGSPLIPEVKAQIEKLKSAHTANGKKPKKTAHAAEKKAPPPE